jgi:hypothetical protein
MVIPSMAYLNVRERRIETKIAYVGPELAGKATNLQRLKSDVARGRATDILETPTEGGALVSLDWTPLQMPRFNDCDIAVKIIAARGTLSEGALGDLLEDVDGVVVVVDASSAAQDENRRAISLVREVLGKDTSVQRPVVVQLNKSDLEDAVPASELAHALQTNDWPVVSASATRGDGVVETLEMALANVLEAMKASGAEPQEVRADHNPLLTALRQILRETVTEHMAALERETVPRLTAAVAAATTSAPAAAPRADGELLARLDRTDRAIAELREALASIRSDASTAASEASQVRMVTDEVAAIVERSAADLTRVAATEARLKEELNAKSKADREHVTSALAVLRRALDAMAVDLKRFDVSEQVAAMGKQIAQLKEKGEGAGSAVPPPAPAQLKALETRLGTIEAFLQRELNGNGSKLGRLSDAVKALHVDYGESLARADVRSTELHAGLAELLDDLKKRKKGWFGG